MFYLQLLHDHKQVGVQYLMTVHELGGLLKPIGFGPLASRTPIKNDVP